MITSRRLFSSGAILLSLGLPSSAVAQSNGIRVEPSGRATTVVTLQRAVPQGTPAAQRPAPMRIAIDYGQPHLRGRQVLPDLIPQGTAWRLGANTSTSMTTDLDITIGDATIPKGSYTLWLLREANGARLIVNKQTGQWGTSYDAAQDLVRIPVRSRTISHPLESLQIALIPSSQGPNGILRITWGTVEYEVNWAVKQ